MKKYIGVKTIEAEPCVAWEDGPDYKKGDSGYKMFQKDGTFYFCPEHVFKDAYSEVDTMTFGLAIEALKKGFPLAREGWVEKGLFVFKQVPAQVEQDIIPKMQSVPQRVKDIVLGRMVKGKPGLNYTNQMCIVNRDGRVDSWVPSSSDIFAKDWIVVE